MNIFKTALGLLTAAAVIPYKVKVDKAGEEEDAPKKVSVESLVYRLDVTPKPEGEEGHDVSLTIPAEGIKKVARFVREKSCVVCAKASAVKNKMEDLHAKHACKKKCGCEDIPEEEITIEVKPEDIMDAPAEEAPAKKSAKKAGKE